MSEHRTSAPEGWPTRMVRHAVGASSPLRSSARRRAVALAVAVALPLTGATAALAATGVTVKNPGGLKTVGPVNTEIGFPAWYEDNKGVRVEPCLDGDNPLCGFLPGDIPDPTKPISFPDNFPEELFYSLAGSGLDLPGGGKATLTLALEGAFANGVQAGDQQVFARARIFVVGGPANTTVTFKHPYGEMTIDTDATGKGRLTEDIAPSVGNFTTPLKGNIGPFVSWDTGAPAGYLGDPAQDHAIKDGPNGNVFTATGADGSQIATTNLFSVQGKIATNTGVQADAATWDGSMLNVFATSDGAQLQVDGQSGKFDTTPLVKDGSRFYARIKPGTQPTTVTVRNLSDKPASTSVVDVTKPSGITVSAGYDYDTQKLTVTATYAGTGTLTATGLGALTGGTPTEFATAAPPATVTVTDGTDSATAPVQVAGAGSTPPGETAIAAGPDLGPVCDPSPCQPGGSSGTGSGTSPAVAQAAALNTSLVRGASTTLDSAGSTTGGDVSYRWTSTGGVDVTIANPTAAKTTVTVPFYTATTDTSPKAAVTGTPKVTLTVTRAGDGSTATADVPLTILTDTVAIAANSRHRLGTELRVTGTSLITGVTGTLAPATSVNVYDATPGHPGVKLGTAQVDTTGAWALRLQPGPTGANAQVTQVLVQSTRGGSATSAVATR